MRLLLIDCAQRSDRSAFAYRCCWYTKQNYFEPVFLLLQTAANMLEYIIPRWQAYMSIMRYRQIYDLAAVEVRSLGDFRMRKTRKI